MYFNLDHSSVIADTELVILFTSLVCNFVKEWTRKLFEWLLVIRYINAFNSGFFQVDNVDLRKRFFLIAFYTWDLG